jgi:putative hydrolase of the HAD superfamily
VPDEAVLDHDRTAPDATTTFVRHALFDFGGPLLYSPFELNHLGEQAMGLEPGSLAKGPFDPDGDPRWRAWQAGEITERQYWAERAAPFGLDIAGYMKAFFEPSGNHLIRPETAALVTEVQSAGFLAGLLTNDLSVFHGPAWREPISVLALFDPLVDLSIVGHLKPDPRAYAAALAAMGVAPGDIVFLDDQPNNVQGAQDAGLVGIWFDITDVAASVERFRTALTGR